MRSEMNPVIGPLFIKSMLITSTLEPSYEISCHICRFKRLNTETKAKAKAKAKAG